MFIYVLYGEQEIWTVKFMWQSCLGLKNSKLDLKICKMFFKKLILQSGWNGLISQAPGSGKKTI